MATGNGKWLHRAPSPLAIGTERLDVTVVGAAVVGRTPVEHVDGDGAADVVDEHEHRDVLADLGPDVDRPVVAQGRERIEDRPLGVTERFLEFVEMVD